MRIAVIDDMASERDSLKKRLAVQMDRFALHGDVFEYASGEAFLAAARQERFDLVFLDIYMDGENGVETAKKLRGFDADCLLVFTTSSTDHALDGFRVRAFQYLVKPYSDEELAALFNEVVARLPAPDQYIEVSIVGGAVRLRYQDILYAEHYQHQIHIRTADGKKTVTRQTFREFTGRLTDDRFFLCSRGVLINLEHAADFDGTDFLLDNGTRIPVSRDLSKTARQAFGDYLFKRRRSL